jgi:hypothetical protein
MGYVGFDKADIGLRKGIDVNEAICDQPGFVL